MSDLIAYLRRTIEATFTTPVTVLRVTKTRAADGGWTTPKDAQGRPTGTRVGTFYGRIEVNRRMAEEQVLQGQTQDRVFYKLYTPLSVGTSSTSATIDRLNPDGAYLTLTDRLQIGGVIYELTNLPTPDTDAPARVLTIWRNSAGA